MSDIETWVDIKDYEGMYQVSDRGRVKSLPRTVKHKDDFEYAVQGRILSGSPNLQGRMGVVLCGDSHKRHEIHVLVALAFLGPRPEGLVVCHNDGDYLNNKASNIRYDTYSENELDKVRHGTHHEANKTHCPRGHSLSIGNLLAKQDNKRQCLACNRAQSYIRRHPEIDLVELAQLCYDLGMTPSEIKENGLI